MKSEHCLEEFFQQKCGVFVTLKKNGELRGCIGEFVYDKNVYELIANNAISAAFEDPRFPSVTLDEMEEILIEVSILTKPEEFLYRKAEELEAKLEKEKSGVILSDGFRRATFLPAVWEELDTPESFLDHLCLKAGLQSDRWREGDLSIKLYTAQVYSEEKPFSK